MNQNETAMVPINKFQEIERRLNALMKKDVTNLGNGEIFFLQEAGQTKRAFKVKVELDCPNHFVFVQGDKAMIIGEGFDKINQYAGIEVFRPKSVVVNSGETRGNPYFEIDENGAMVSIFLRGIGIGYAPTGNLTAIDQTLYINLQTLLVQELQAKLKKYPHLGVLGTKSEKPTKIIFHKKKDREYEETPTILECSGYWYFVPTVRDLGYWCNLSHPEILSAFESFSQKQRFLERTATTILKRLIISSHPAVATKTPIITQMGEKSYGRISSGKGYVIVYGFKPEAGNARAKHEELSGLAEKLEAGQKISDMEIKEAERVDGGAEVETQSPEMVASPEELPPEETPEDADFTPSEPPPEETPPDPVPDEEKPPAKPPAAKPPAKTPPPAAKPPDLPQPLPEDHWHKALEAFMLMLQKDPEKQKKAVMVRVRLGFPSWGDLRKGLPEAKCAFLDAATKEGLC